MLMVLCNPPDKIFIQRYPERKSKSMLEWPNLRGQQIKLVAQAKKLVLGGGAEASQFVTAESPLALLKRI